MIMKQEGNCKKYESMLLLEEFGTGTGRKTAPLLFESRTYKAQINHFKKQVNTQLKYVHYNQPKS